MYWEFVILARKLAIVSSEGETEGSRVRVLCGDRFTAFLVIAVAVGLRGTSSYQLAMMLLVLFAAFCAQASLRCLCSTVTTGISLLRRTRAG